MVYIYFLKTTVCFCKNCKYYCDLCKYISNIYIVIWSELVCEKPLFWPGIYKYLISLTNLLLDTIYVMTSPHKSLYIYIYTVSSLSPPIKATIIKRKFAEGLLEMLSLTRTINVQRKCKCVSYRASNMLLCSDQTFAQLIVFFLLTPYLRLKLQS